MNTNFIHSKPMVPNQQVPLVDDSAVQEVYADSLVGLNFNQGNVNLVFACLRGDHTKQPPTNYRKISGRLVLPAAVVVELHSILGQIITDLETKGVIKKTAPQFNVVS